MRCTIPHKDLLLRAAEQRSFVHCCSSLKATKGRATTETPVRTKAGVQTKRVKARLLQEAPVLLQKSPVLAREAVAPLASTAQVHSKEALAPTTVVEPPLQRTPVLA
jgi:uncharacterized protein YdgA (DUF945 family)